MFYVCAYIFSHPSVYMFFLTIYIWYSIFKDIIYPVFVSFLKIPFHKRITFGMSFHTFFNKNQFAELQVITHSHVLKL